MYVLSMQYKLADYSQESAYIINVSAMEGSFSRYFKPSSHPHTNMAKVLFVYVL